MGRILSPLAGKPVSCAPGSRRCAKPGRRTGMAPDRHSQPLGEYRLARRSGALLFGNLTFDDSNFAGIGLSRVVVPSFSIPVIGTDHAFRGNRIEIEGQVLRHFGDQNHWDGTIALMFRTGQIPLFQGLSVNFAFREGLSYASERPRLEGSFRVEPTRFLNYLAFEAEFSHASLPGVYFVPRIHHRSGVFGVIAPKESGSNFIGAGLRIDLP
jgi:hypothetical protein